MRHGTRSESGPDDERLLHDAERARSPRALVAGLVAGVVVVLGVVALVVQNGDAVPFEWTVVDVDVPLWLLLVGAALVGVGLALAVRALAAWSRVRVRKGRAAHARLFRRGRAGQGSPA